MNSIVDGDDSERRCEQTHVASHNKFMDTIDKIDDEKLVGTKIRDREGIFDAIKVFLGKGY